MNEEPIFILGAHKSGTTLLRGVFDGHPDLFVIPFESHFFQNLSYWVDYDYRKEQPRTLTDQQIIDRFRKRLQHLNETEDQLGDAPGSFEINLARFMKTFEQFSTAMNPSEQFKLYAESVHQALFDAPLPPEKKVVEKSVENAEFAPLLHRMFPGARFVHIVRNPYANMVSLRRAKTVQSGFPLVFRMLDSLYNNYYHLYRNRQLIDDYYVIRYEDLLENPKQSIKKLAQLLELPMDPALLQPTKFGQPWSGNSSTGQEFSGFDASRIDSWKSAISPMEILFTNRQLSYPFEAFGYSKLPDTSMTEFLKPVQKEGLKRWLINRLYLAYLSYNPGKEL